MTQKFLKKKQTTLKVQKRDDFKDTVAKEKVDDSDGLQGKLYDSETPNSSITW